MKHTRTDLDDRRELSVISPDNLGMTQVTKKNGQEKTEKEGSRVILQFASSVTEESQRILHKADKSSNRVDEK